MKQERISARNEAGEQRTGAAKPSFNIAVVYANPRAAARAMNVFGGLLRESPELTPEALEKRANTVSSVLQGILHRGMTPPGGRGQG